MTWVDGIGVVAVVVTTVSILPQIYKVIKTKRADDISVVMYIVALSGQVLWIVYGSLKKDYQIIAANVVCTSLAGIMLALRVVYSRGEETNNTNVTTLPV